VILNAHERWLLRRVGLTGHDRRAMLAAIRADHQHGGDIDAAAQLPGIELAKRGVQDDLAAWFDRLLNPVDPSVAHVVYGHRTYRKEVVLAAALRQAGIPPSRYTRGREKGARQLAQFKTV
jgi:hypothetical protein